MPNTGSDLYASNDLGDFHRASVEQATAYISTMPRHLLGDIALPLDVVVATYALRSFVARSDFAATKLGTEYKRSFGIPFKVGTLSKGEGSALRAYIKDTGSTEVWDDREARSWGEAILWMKYSSDPVLVAAADGLRNEWTERLEYAIEHPEVIPYLVAGIYDMELVKKAVADDVDPELTKAAR